MPHLHPYERVFVIGLDAAGTFIQKANTPIIDNFIAGGAVTYQATSIPAESAEGWGAMLHGVGGDKHGLTYGSVLVTPYPEDSPYPSIFKVIQQARPGAMTASLVNWNPINTGIIEQSLLLYRDSAPDDELTLRIANYIRTKGKETIYTFMVFDDPDAAGHKYGWETSAYFQALEKTDSNVGIVLDAIHDAGLQHESLILIVTDHGGHDCLHGTLDPRDTTVFWAAQGHTIVPGSTIKASLHVKDTAAVAAYALGLECPPQWDAQIPPGLFIQPHI